MKLVKKILILFNLSNIKEINVAKVIVYSTTIFIDRLLMKKMVIIIEVYVPLKHMIAGNFYTQSISMYKQYLAVIEFWKIISQGQETIVN